MPKYCFWGGSFMSQISYSPIKDACLDLDETSPIYFGLKKDCFDMHAMRYRVFGAVWKSIDGKKIILNYWFGDSEDEIQFNVKKAGYFEFKLSNLEDIKEVFQSIRLEQELQNWFKRRKLPILTIWKRPWKNLRKGWYVLKSTNDFPTVLTCIQKKQFSIWVEHIQVCETEEDIRTFLNLVNTEHSIKLITEMKG
jgi:hypothetical protein